MCVESVSVERIIREANTLQTGPRFARPMAGSARPMLLLKEQHTMDHSHIIDLRDMLGDLVTTLRHIDSKVEQIAAALTAIDEVAESPHAKNGLAIDREQLTISWNGSRCYMGYTIPFRLLERLARRPNQYITHECLLHDIWGGPRSKSALRSAVNNLRSHLISAGMGDLAKAIDGSNAGRYGLILNGRH